MAATKSIAHFIFRFPLIIALSAVVLLFSNSYAATYDVYGGTKAFWPDGSWIPVPSLGDPHDGAVTRERLDLVGATILPTTPVGDETNYAFYRYTDDTYAYFRMRMDEGTYTAGDWADTVWIIIDGDADGDPDYALAWDTKGMDGPVVHGLEFQVINTNGSSWSATDFDDIDQDSGSKFVDFSTCTGTCWWVDIPYTPWTYGTSYYAGYMRIVDNQSTTAWGTTMFIDIAVSWDYLIDASIAAHSRLTDFPVLSKSGQWKLQTGSLFSSNDHGFVSADVGASSTPGASPKVFSGVVTYDNTIILTSGVGTYNQTVDINTPITNITYSTTGATGATFFGLPDGVTGTWAANGVTISGTPTAEGTYDYTVTLTGGYGNITTSGKITVIVVSACSPREIMAQWTVPNGASNPPDTGGDINTVSAAAGTADNQKQQSPHGHRLSRQQRPCVIRHRQHRQLFLVDKGHGYHGELH